VAASVNLLAGLSFNSDICIGLFRIDWHRMRELLLGRPVLLEKLVEPLRVAVIPDRALGVDVKEMRIAGKTTGDNLRREDHEQLRAHILDVVAAEGDADERDVAEERH